MEIFQIFLGCIVQAKLQQMSHAARYISFANVSIMYIWHLWESTNSMQKPFVQYFDICSLKESKEVHYYFFSIPLSFHK
jgi:hypothetical protein